MGTCCRILEEVFRTLQPPRASNRFASICLIQERATATRKRACTAPNRTNFGRRCPPDARGSCAARSPSFRPCLARSSLRASHRTTARRIARAVAFANRRLRPRIAPSAPAPNARSAQHIAMADQSTRRQFQRARRRMRSPALARHERLLPAAAAPDQRCRGYPMRANPWKVATPREHAPNSAMRRLQMSTAHFARAPIATYVNQRPRCSPLSPRSIGRRRRQRPCRQ